MMNDRFYRMLGLAVRAGGTVFGESATKDSFKGKTAQLVLLSEDASENTKKRFRNSCLFYSVPYFEYSDRYTLGKATGKSFAVVISITNKELAKQLIELLSEA